MKDVFARLLAIKNKKDIALKVATANIANNLTTEEAGKVLDARQGKELSTQISQLTDYAHGKLLASVTVEAPVYPGTDITIDTDEDTLVVDGYTPTNGDRVAFYPSAGDFSTLPAGLQGGFAYHVVGTSGATFQVSKTVGGAAVDITGIGTAASYFMEKVSVGNITVSGLTSDRCRFTAFGTMAGAGVGGDGYSYLRMTVNGKSTGLYVNSGGSSILTNGVLLFYSSSNAPIHVCVSGTLRVKNNRLYAVIDNAFMESVGNSAITTMSKVLLLTDSAFTLEDDAFASSIASISFDAGSDNKGFFGNGFTVEVYNG